VWASQSVFRLSYFVPQDVVAISLSDTDEALEFLMLESGRDTSWCPFVRSAGCNVGGIRLTFVDNPLDLRGCMTHIRALKVAGDDLLEVILTIDDVSWQIIQPGRGEIC
jgi:hypothetical protein